MVTNFSSSELKTFPKIFNSPSVICVELTLALFSRWMVSSDGSITNDRSALAEANEGISLSSNINLVVENASNQSTPSNPEQGMITGRNVHCFSLVLDVLTLINDPSTYAPNLEA